MTYLLTERDHMLIDEQDKPAFVKPAFVRRVHNPHELDCMLAALIDCEDTLAAIRDRAEEFGFSKDEKSLLDKLISKSRRVIATVEDPANIASGQKTWKRPL